MTSKAFTLVELIAVITVIVILIGLVAVGFNQVEKARAASHTRTVFAAIRLPLSQGKMMTNLQRVTSTDVGSTTLLTSLTSTMANTFAGSATAASVMKYLFGTDGLAELNNLGALDPSRPQFLIDAWGNPIMMHLNPRGELVLMSAGKNGAFENPWGTAKDDLVDGNIK